MSGVDQTQLALRRAQDAAALLDADSFLMQCFKEIRDVYFQAWVQSDARATDDRERIHARLRAMDDIEGMFRAYVADGQVVRARLLQQEEDRNNPIPGSTG